MNKELKMKAVELRKSLGLSYNEISKQLQVNKSTLSGWLKAVELTEEQKVKLRNNNPVYSGYHVNGATKESRLRAAATCSATWRKRRTAYQKKGEAENKSFNLHLAGCMLYWAEGGKGRHCVIFTNTDVDMMQLFIRFLIECYGVTKDEISILCHSHILSKKTLQEVEEYWLEKLSLPKECLRKGFVETRIPKRKKVKYPYGICSLTVCNVEIVQRIFGSIKAYTGIPDKDKWLT